MMDEYVVHAEETARQVLFLFHGYGSDNRNLEPVGRILADAVPGMEVRLPRGIVKRDLVGSGLVYQIAIWMRGMTIFSRVLRLLCPTSTRY